MPCDGASPSSEESGLLSLPWEMVTHIASHLSAQCVISVLPKVGFYKQLSSLFRSVKGMTCDVVLLVPSYLQRPVSFTYQVFCCGIYFVFLLANYSIRKNGISKISMC